MAYGDFKDLTEKTASDKVFCGKAFNIAKIRNMDIKVDLLEWFRNNFIKSLLLHVQVNLLVKVFQYNNWQELHKPISRKGGKHKVYSSFKDNIWSAVFGSSRYTINK